MMKAVCGTPYGVPTFNNEDMNEYLNISHYVLQTKALGPYLRSAVWVNGCCFNCKGCIAEEMNHQIPERRKVEELIEVFANVDSSEGITISGGEPFLQASPLLAMLEGIKNRKDYGVIIYTGFTLEELQSKESREIQGLLSNADILIDGRYQNDLDDGKPFRGSSNQRIILLTDRYRDVYNEYYLGRSKRNVEIRVETDHVYMIGVPSRDGLRTWKELKKRAEGNVE